MYIELDIYIEAFENHEISGHELICLDQEKIIKTLNILHPIHCSKIAMHANILRDKVLKKASSNIPKLLKDWDYEHVAGWLRFNLQCPKCALLSLRNKLDGAMLTELLIEDITDILGGDGDVESAKSIMGIRDLIEQDIKQNVQSPRPMIPLVTVTKTKKHIIKETAIKKRRKSKDAPHEKKSENDNIIIHSDTEVAQVLDKESILHDSKIDIAPMVQIDPPEPKVPKLSLHQTETKNEQKNFTDNSALLNKSVEYTVQKAEVDAIILSSRVDNLQISPRKTIDETPNHIKDAIKPIMLPDVSFNNKFADKIFELQKIIETQAASFAEMQKETERLREDKRIANQRLELVANENKHAKDAIKVLEKDRKNIEKMLVDVTTKVNSLDSDKSKLAKQIKKIEEEVSKPPEVIKEKVYLSSASSIDNALDYIGLNGAGGKNNRGYKFENLSLREIMDDAATEEINLFDHLSRKYIIENDSDFGVSETRTILQRIASLWMRLGHRIYEDSRKQTESMTDEEFIVLNDIKKCIKALYLADNTNALSNNSLTMDEINEYCQQPYIIAAGYVFLIGIIRRIFDRYGSIKENKDRAQLMSLFTQMRQGEIRNFTELSRENFRLFSEETLGLSFQNNWDKLDAVCQRLDPDKKGFIKFTALIHAFRVITPIIDLLPNSITADQRVHDRSLSTKKRHEVLFNAQYIMLFVLSLSTEFIISSAISSSSILASTTSLGSVTTTDTSPRKSLTIHEIITQMISSKIESTPSFKLFVTCSDDDKARGKGDSKLIHLLQLIGDIIYELIKPYITAQNKSKEYYEGMKKNLGVQSNSKNFFLTFIASHCRECTMAVAKALQIYDSFDPSTSIMEFSSLYLTYFLFRRSCLIALLDNQLPLDVERQYSKINKKSIKSTIAVMESIIVSFIGDEDAKIMFTTSNINGIEKCMSELLGFFIPAPGILSFASCQCDIEYYILQVQEIKAKNNKKDNSLLNTLISLNHASTVSSKDPYTSILKEIHNSLNETEKKSNATKIARSDMKENIPNNISTNQSMTSPNNKKVKKRINSIVIQEVNKVLTSQRLNQLTSYLDYLNNKAYSKKQILQVLVNLWYSTTTITSADKESYLKCIKTHEDLGNSLILNKNEILKRTTEMQKSLLASMQEVPTTKISALANRVEMVKEAMVNKSIDDDDNALQEVLENIDVLEKSLLTANTDAMALATNIVNKLKCIV